MTWFLYALAAFIGFNGLMSVAMVGKPRKPLESSTAAIIVLIDALIVAGLIVTAVSS